MEPMLVPVSTQTRDALARTRPWMYFLGIVSVIGAIICAIVVLAGLLRLGTGSLHGGALIAGGLAGGVVATVLAVFQLAYAATLGKVADSEGAALEGLVEQACIRQRRLWIALGVIYALAALGYLLRAIAAIAGAPG